MKDLIIQALTTAFEMLQKQVPLTKKKTVYVSIDSVKPLGIAEFMKKNNIPESAWLGGKPNGYDSFDEVCLCYEKDVPTTKEEKLKFKKKRFTSVAWKHVYDLLTNSGYKRVGYNTGLLKEFDSTTVYDMFVNKEFDKLVKYYSLPFLKLNT